MRRGERMVGKPPLESESQLTVELESPPMPEVTFFFSGHAMPEDYKGIEDALAEADVFVIESHSWTLEGLKKLQQIADGEVVPAHIEAGRPPKDLLEYEDGLLYNTGKRIEMVDVPQGHELDEKDDSNTQFIEIAGRFLAQGDVDERMAELNSTAAVLASYLNEKDVYIESQLRSLVERLSEEDPGAKVLVQMGSMHTNISHNMRREGSSASRVSNEVRYSFGEELVRRYRFDREVSEELSARALLEYVFRLTFIDSFNQVPVLDRTDFFREHLSALTVDQARLLGQLTGSLYMDRVVMQGELDSREMNQDILSDAWKTIVGDDIRVAITRLAESHKDTEQMETTFVHGRVYANAELARYIETIPVEEVLLSTLADQVGPEHTYWADEDGAPLRPYDLIQDWEAAQENPLWKPHVDSIKRANLDNPIWKLRDGHVIDGMHRLTRAVLDGVDTVKVRFVDDIPDSIPSVE